MIDGSLDNAKITEFRQAFALLRVCFGPDGLRDSTIVLAINFFQFVSNANLWQSSYTYLELDLLRYGLFDGPQGAVAPVVHWRWMPYIVSAMRPVLAG